MVYEWLYLIIHCGHSESLFLLVIHGLKCGTILHGLKQLGDMKSQTFIEVASQKRHDHPLGGLRLSGLLGAKEDNLPRENLWLQTKFTALRGQDPRRIPYDPKARQGSGPWLAMPNKNQTIICHDLEGVPRSPEFNPYLPWPDAQKSWS